ncbi:hypothetical protein HS7_20560 [Sulfolobales archaeon HS-7]|nr:hypothetical protein HS7_20560 [Sulfolobales archaeon HS-7]
MSYPNHHTIQRMSVLIVGIILVLGIVAMLANYKPSQTGPIAIQNPSPTITTPPLNVTPPKLNITNFTATYSFTNAVESLNATDIYTFNSTKLLEFEYAYNPLASTVADILSLSASQVTPWTYSELYNILDSKYTHWTSTRTVSMYYYPMNMSMNTIYLNFAFQTNPQFVNAYEQLNRNYPFPPSDNITVNSPVYRIINKTSVTTSVNVQFSNYTYLIYNYTYKSGNTVYEYLYYDSSVEGYAYLYANNQLINSQYFYYNFYWWGGSYTNTLYGEVTVPPGMMKQVYADYTILMSPGYGFQEKQQGNVTYYIYKYYPAGPYVSMLGYMFNWYEYNVLLQIKILVYNGSNPVTYVNNQTYNSRTINVIVSYNVWSSDPKTYTNTIKTLDHIMFLKYNLTRIWHAGSITINPTCYIQQIGNAVNYYLNFNIQNDIIEPPSYIFHPVHQLNETTVLQWSYFLNNYIVVKGLYNAVHENIDEFNYILPQFVTSVYKENLTLRTITIASFIEPWNVSQVTLNVSGVLAKSNMIFIPVNITPNTSYSIIYSALGSIYTIPNVTLLSYEWNNMTGSGYFPPLVENELYNGTIPPPIYAPFMKNIVLNYGYYWPYRLPYVEFSIQQLQKNYEYWYNPAWPGWFPIS